MITIDNITAGPMSEFKSVKLSQTQDFENEPVVLPVYIKNTCPRAKSPVVNIGRQASALTSVYDTILLHFPSSCPPPSSKTQLFISSVMLSVLLIIGLPFAPVPLPSIFIVCFTLYHCVHHPWSPYQLNMACIAFNVMFSTPKSLLISSLAVRSLLRQPCSASTFSGFKQHLLLPS